MTLWERVIESFVVAAIAFISARIAISTTEHMLPGAMDLYTSFLAFGLAFLVRFATLSEYEPEG